MKRRIEVFSMDYVGNGTHSMVKLRFMIKPEKNIKELGIQKLGNRLNLLFQVVKLPGLKWKLKKTPVRKIPIFRDLIILIQML